MKTAIYPGTFDPITYGHIDVIKKSLNIFDRLIVATTDNVNKNYHFSIDERLNIINNSLLLSKSLIDRVFNSSLTRTLLILTPLFLISILASLFKAKAKLDSYWSLHKIESDDSYDAISNELLSYTSIAEDGSNRGGDLLRDGSIEVKLLPNYGFGCLAISRIVEG